MKAGTRRQFARAVEHSLSPNSLSGLRIHGLRKLGPIRMLPGSSFLQEVLYSLLVNDSVRQYGIPGLECSLLDARAGLRGRTELGEDLKLAAEVFGPNGGMISVGAYTESVGAPGPRDLVRKAFELRDAAEIEENGVVLCEGFNSGVKYLIATLCHPGEKIAIQGDPSGQLESAAKNLGIIPIICSLEGIEKTLETPGLRFVVLEGPQNLALSPQRKRDIIELCADRGVLLFVEESTFQLPPSIYKPSETPQVPGHKFDQKTLDFSSFHAEFCKLEKTGARQLSPLIVGYDSSESVFPERGSAGCALLIKGLDSEVLGHFKKYLAIMLAPNSVGQINTAFSFGFPYLIQSLSPAAKKLIEDEASRNRTILQRAELFLHKTTLAFPELQLPPTFGASVTFKLPLAKIEGNSDEVAAHISSKLRTLKISSQPVPAATVYVEISKVFDTQNMSPHRLGEALKQFIA